MNSKVHRCKGCGRPILFVTTANGASMPVDVQKVEIAPDDRDHETFYYDAKVSIPGHIVNMHTKGHMVKPFTPGSELAYRSHFATCPAAGKFSGASRRKAPPADDERPRRASGSGGAQSVSGGGAAYEQLRFI